MIVLKLLKNTNVRFHNYKFDKLNNFKVLGLDNRATIEEVKSRYLKLIKLYHPDTNSNDKIENAKSNTKKFLDIRKAYEEILFDFKEGAKHQNFIISYRRSKNRSKQKASNTDPTQQNDTAEDCKSTEEKRLDKILLNKKLSSESINMRKSNISNKMEARNSNCDQKPLYTSKMVNLYIPTKNSEFTEQLVHPIERHYRIVATQEKEETGHLKRTLGDVSSLENNEPEKIQFALNTAKKAVSVIAFAAFLVLILGKWSLPISLYILFLTFFYYFINTLQEFHSRFLGF